MLRRVLSALSLPAALVIGVCLGLGIIPHDPRWARWAMYAIGVLMVAVPVLVLLVVRCLALRGGLIAPSRFPYTVSVEAGDVVVLHRGRVERHLLANVRYARRARDGNWIESDELEGALGLFSAKRSELVRVPLSATGIDALLRELESRGVPIEDVFVDAPALHD